MNNQEQTIKQRLEKRLQWLNKAIDDEENQAESMQIKLWAEINLIKDVLK